MTFSHLSRFSPKFLFRGAVLCVVFGSAIRLGLAQVSAGSNDVVIWQELAREVGRMPMARVYEEIPRFNHPPLMGYLVYGISQIAQGRRFALLLKVPALLGELLTMLLLYRIWTARAPWTGVLALALYALSLDSILVSGFHGNTDALCAALCLLSAYWLQQGRSFLGGLALAGALNIKLIPLVLVAPWCIHCRTPKHLRNLLAGLAIGVIPFLPFIVMVGSSLYRNAVSYASNADNWGVMFILNASLSNPVFAPFAAGLYRGYFAIGRYIVILGASALAVIGRLRRWTPYQIGFVAMALFLVAGPGFGVQYTIYPVPFLFAYNLGRAWIYSLTAGFFIGTVYFSFWTGSVPINSGLTTPIPLPTSLFGLLPWALLAVYMAKELNARVEQDHSSATAASI